MKKLSERKRKWIERTVANDRSGKIFLYNRFYLFALLVLLQIGGFVFLQYLFVFNTRIGVLLQAAVEIIGLVCVLYIVNQDVRTSLKLSWVLIVLIAPVFGVPFYVYFGRGRPARKMKKKLEATKAANAQRIKGRLGEEEPALPENRAQGVERYLASHAGYPAYRGGSVTYYESGEKTFPAMKAELEKAKKFILVEYFIVAHGKMWGETLEILLKKAEEGVQIRIIYDDFGCMTTLPPRYDRYLESLHENIKALSFNEVVPVFALRLNNRDHRKILVVDGTVAFTGGINLADEYINEKRRFGYWKDTGVRITGGGVCSFIQMFFDIWNAFREDKEDVASYAIFALNATLPPSGGSVIQPFDDSPLDGKSVSESVYVDLLQRAVRFAYIFTPYLLLDDAVRSAMVRAAERGVDVRIVTPGIPDKKLVYRMTRANYGALLQAGVKIYEYTPGFIHAKSLVVDDGGVVGTINFDYRSLYLHFEDGVYFTDPQAIADLKRDCEETFTVSKPCTKENTKRGWIGRLVDSILRVFEGLA